MPSSSPEHFLCGPSLAPCGLSRAWAEIDIAALVDNARVCLEAAGPGGGLMAILKADAYGHGVGPVARALESHVRAFGVAGVAEAQELARALPQGAGGRPAREILVLGPLYPGEREALVQGGFSASLSQVEEVRALANGVTHGRSPVPVHAVADTGMGRMGARGGAFLELVAAIRREPALRLAGVASHFSSADEDEAATRGQMRDFENLLLELRKSGLLTPEVSVHLGNSAGLLRHGRDMPWAPLFRPGLALYGVSPLPDSSATLRQVMTVKARVSLVRDLPAGWPVNYGRTFVTPGPMRVATLGIGYADGFPRALSGKGASVLIHGARCPVLGRVTMDQIVVDISHLPGTIVPGEEAVVCGTQGRETISASELAQRAGTIAWEILTGISSRVKRVPVFV